MDGNQPGSLDAIPGGADALVRAVLAVVDPGMRLASLARTFDLLQDEEIVAFLEALQARAVQGSSPARAILIDLSRIEPTKGPPTLDQIAGWRAAARAAGSATLAMLTERTPRQVAYAHGAVNINEHLDDTPLGRRKALARGTDRPMLDRLLHDKHPAVVEILLSNARIVERDVVRMAANRPTSASALATIAQHPRWVRRYAVRSALTQNPYTPPELAIRLLPTLTLTEVRRTATNLKLHPEVRARARALAEERGVHLKRPEDAPEPAGPVSSEVDIHEADEGVSGVAGQILAEAMGAVSAREAARRRGGEGDADASASETAADEGDGWGDEADEDADALAADFLANLGPLRLVPVGGDDEGEAPPAAPRLLRLVELEDDDALDVEIVAVSPARAPAEAPRRRPPWDDPTPSADEVDAIAEAFMEDLEIVLVPVEDEGRG